MTYHNGGNTIEVGATGRSEILRILSAVLEPRLMSILMAQAVADDILRALRETGYVIVPKTPTKQMLEEAYYDALAEDAAGVWEAMIQTYADSNGNSSGGSG